MATVAMQSGYSAATAALLYEVLKGVVSLAIAYGSTTVDSAVSAYPYAPPTSERHHKKNSSATSDDASGPNASVSERAPVSKPAGRLLRLRHLVEEIFMPEGWSLAVPAVLYIVQDKLYAFAALRLDPATLQVAYQLRILTTAVLSVWLLQRSLSWTKWAALLILAQGMAVLELSRIPVGSTAVYVGGPLEYSLGFGAVLLATVAFGLAAASFEVALKVSSASLWVRSVQLSMFSAIPALMAALQPVMANGQVIDIFEGFGWRAWLAVSWNVAAGLTMAFVVKYTDNIVKMFAISMMVVLSYTTSLILFPDTYQPNWAFAIGVAAVLGAAFLYERKGGALSHAITLVGISWPTTELPTYSSPSSTASSPGPSPPVEDFEPVPSIEAMQDATSALLTRRQGNFWMVS